MPRDSGGNYSLPLSAVAAGTVVDPDWANDTLNDVASALTGSLPRDGSVPMTGPLQVVPRGSPLINDVITNGELDAEVTSQIAALFPNLAGASWSLANKIINYTIVLGDAWKIIGANASSLVITLPAPASAGNGYIVFVLGTNAATVARAAAETINGTAASWTLRANSLVAFICDGTNWLALEIQRANDTKLTTPTLDYPTIKSIKETKQDITSISSTLAIDVSAGAWAVISLGAAVTTLTFSNVPASPNVFALTLEIVQGATWGWTWPASVKWPGGSAPVVTATAGKKDVFTLITRDGGSNWLGFVAGQNF